ncbi:hypothetical protein KUW19_00640 [Ferrimonas balearica]|uniref:hypothetical protein n=1 Tax=Ferrimonas balearica TaxID=44012 RepID=UPI001C93902A|nr:hypothetical protein [Ferrimonas balearica]MBY6104983.1 hypothetical protein [Ferrimonas balearica]
MINISDQLTWPLSSLLLFHGLRFDDPEAKDKLIQIISANIRERAEKERWPEGKLRLELSRAEAAIFGKGA